MADERESQSEISLPIEWVVDENTPSGYASNLVVQHTEHEFVLSFFELKPPVLIGEPDERKTQAQKLGSVKAKCIAQITIPITRIPEFLNAINTNYQRFLDESQAESDQ